MIRRLITLLVVAGLVGCQQKKEPESTSLSAETQVVESAENETFQPFPVQSTVKNLRMRDQPGLESEEIAELNKNDEIIFLGDISELTTKIKLRGVDFDEPWLKVKARGKEGWVYAGGVKFEMGGVSKATKKKLINTRLKKFFGVALGEKIAIYQTDFEAIQTQEDFQKVHQQAFQLRDSLNEVLNRQLSRYDLEKTLGYEQLPDLFWIDDGIPSMTLEVVAEGTEYYLFIDYNDFVPVASISEGTVDDAFMELTIEIYPDSVEYFFPAWLLQTWDYGGFSLLGSGKHQSIMDKMEAIWEKGDLFKEELKGYKSELMESITEWRKYGYGKEKILVELDAIVANDYSFLLQGDVITLKNRRGMFEKPMEFELELGMRDSM